MFQAKSYKLDVIKMLRKVFSGMRSGRSCLEKVKNEWKTGATWITQTPDPIVTKFEGMLLGEPGVCFAVH